MAKEIFAEVSKLILSTTIELIHWKQPISSQGHMSNVGKVGKHVRQLLNEVSIYYLQVSTIPTFCLIRFHQQCSPNEPAKKTTTKTPFQPPQHLHLRLLHQFKMQCCLLCWSLAQCHRPPHPAPHNSSLHWLPCNPSFCPQCNPTHNPTPPPQQGTSG